MIQRWIRKPDLKTTALLALVLLNAALLLSLLGVHPMDNPARAQIAARRPGDYLMVDGQITGSTAGVVYVIDSVNGQLTALTFTGQAGAGSGVEAMPPINLGAVFSQEPTPASGVKSKTR